MPWKRVNWHPSRFTQGESIPSFSMRGRRILKSLCYFVGIFFTEMGCLGIIASIYSPSPSMAYIPALLLLFSLSLINMLLFFRTRYRAPCLFWSQYFWAIVAATVGVALILLPEAVFVLTVQRNPPALFSPLLIPFRAL